MVHQVRFSIGLLATVISCVALAREPQQNDSSIGDLPDVTQSLRLLDYTETVANLMIQNSLAHKAFVESFNSSPRVDYVFVTQVRDDVTRYKIVGRDFDGDVLKGCIEWQLSRHRPKPGSKYVESVASKVSRTDCRLYENWEKFIDPRK